MFVFVAKGWGNVLETSQGSANANCFSFGVPLLVWICRPQIENWPRLQTNWAMPTVSWVFQRLFEASDKVGLLPSSEQVILVPESSGWTQELGDFGSKTHASLPKCGVICAAKMPRLRHGQAALFENGYTIMPRKIDSTWRKIRCFHCWKGHRMEWHAKIHPYHTISQHLISSSYHTL